MAKDANRCWPGYEPVKGKKKNEQGSCQPKAESKLSGKEKEFRGKRQQQLSEWQKAHPGSPKKAAQHLHKPDTTTKTAKAKTKRATKRASKKAA